MFKTDMPYGGVLQDHEKAVVAGKSIKQAVETGLEVLGL